MWTFLKVLLAFLTGSAIVDVFGPRVLWDITSWIFTEAWWLVIHVLLPFFVLTAIISSAYLLRRDWKKLMAKWEYEKAHTSKTRRVGE